MQKYPCVILNQFVCNVYDDHTNMYKPGRLSKIKVLHHHAYANKSYNGLHLILGKSTNIKNQIYLLLNHTLRTTSFLFRWLIRYLDRLRVDPPWRELKKFLKIKDSLQLNY